MRTISGPRNRTVLALSGLFAILAGVWMFSPQLALSGVLPQLDAVLPDGRTTAGDLIGQAPPAWLAPAGLAASALLAVLGLLLLMAQIPAAPRRLTLRITGEEDALLGSLEPQVLERALTESMGTVTGVQDCQVALTGSVGGCHVQATVGVTDDCDIEWVVNTLRHQVSDQVETVLGRSPLTVDLLVRLRSPHSHRSTRATRTEDTPAITRTSTASITSAEAPASAPVGAR